MNDIENRITQLETNLAYMLDFTETLNEVVKEQAQMIARLEHKNRMLATRLEELQQKEKDTLVQEKPPHY